MPRILVFGIGLLLICVHSLGATNPDDIEFRVRLAKGTKAYQMGESIELEIVYSSHSEKKYQRNSTSSLENVNLRLTPSDGVVDLRLLRWEGGLAGSVIGGMGYLTSQPVTQQLDLCVWYRFYKPGHYSVMITSKEVSRLKSAEEGGGEEHLTLESAPVEFDILQADSAWAAGELSNIEEALRVAEAPGESARAIGRLARLDTPASVQKLLQLYFAKSDVAPEWLISSDLHESSQIDVIVPSLKAALSDPTLAVPSTLPGLLASLQTRKELGMPVAYPADPAKQREWTEKSNERSDSHAKHLEQANTLLMASIDRRTGRSRATAIYQGWSDAEFQNRTKPLSPEALSQLRLNVLAVENDLDREQQLQFVVLAWQTMPHEQLLPMIRKLTKDSDAHGAIYSNYEAFRLWCEGWQDDCSAAILSDVLESGVKTEKNIILLMSEAEHPELDKMLETQLHDPTILQDSAQSQRVAALILRAGSRRVAPSVDTLLDQFSAKPGCAGEIQGYLLGYLFRLAPEDAGKRLAADLRNRNSTCGWEVLRNLDVARYSDDLISIVTRALDSPNLVSAQAAALFLGGHGPASAEEALWKRLEELWRAWRERSFELQGPHSPMSSGDNIQEQTAGLERALASALSHGTNWKLSPARLERLRADCLTEPCRDIAAGKMFLNL
jgi:hypothetical protein